MDRSSKEAEARRRSQINDQLQRRFLEPQLRNLGFGSVLAALVAVFLWPHANHQGLIVWVALVFSTLLPIAILRRVQPPFPTFYRSVIVLEVLSGAAWGSGSIIAMPDTTIWQSIMLMLFIGVLMSGASNMAHFFGVFVAFHLPLAIVVSTGFLLSGSWPTGPFLSIWIFGSVYVGASAFEARGTQADLVTSILDLGAANLQLDEQARTDKLTGLANRLDFTERLEARIRARSADQNEGDAGRPLTLAYMDIDRFKQINDEFGHHVGDELLQQAARRLLAAASETEVVARLGGDEKTILSSVDAHSLGARVLSCFDTPFMIDGRTIDVNVSVGVASAAGDISGDMLMRNADAALYAAKNAGGARHVVFGRALELKNEQRLTQEAELQAALVNGEIVPWIQPIVDMETGEIVAGEALARWQHRDGVRSAATFIETIRQVGLMTEFTEQLLHVVDEFHRSMANAGGPIVPISVNVPCSHLQHLLRAETTPTLVIEITEETAIEEMAETRALLETLRNAGHQVWLDDFGTGFSSMAVAAQLPIDGLKIDRAFVAELLTSGRFRGVVAAIVELANQLSIGVVAEGVEHESQAVLLRKFGIGLAQGHLWSPAVPMEQFAQWMAEGHRFNLTTSPELEMPR